MCHRPTNRRPRSHRADVPLTLLWEWIDCEVLDQLNARQTFTAYSITKALRAAHPDQEVIHEDVQSRVHYIMAIVNDYALTWEVWNGELARTYAPICLTAPKAETPFWPTPFWLRQRIDWEKHGTL